VVGWWHGVVVNMLVSISAFGLRRALLLLGWVTIG